MSLAPIEAPAAQPDDAPAPYWKCVAAALPDLFLALQFLMVAVRGQPFLGAGVRGLTGLMRVEFIVIHATVFLGALALWKTETAGQARARAACFWGLFTLYFLLALKGGVLELAAFLFLSFSTYLGLFLNWRSSSALVQLGVRWVASFVIFLFAVGVCRTPKDVDRWVGNADVLLAGAIYFAALGLVELSGFHLRYIPPRANRIRAFVASARGRGSKGRAD